jgi:hypothetical protein
MPQSARDVLQEAAGTSRDTAKKRPNSYPHHLRNSTARLLRNGRRLRICTRPPFCTKQDLRQWRHEMSTLKTEAAHEENALTSGATPNAPELFHDFLFLSLISFNELHLLLQHSLFHGVGGGHGCFLQLQFFLLLLLLQCFRSENLLPCQSCMNDGLPLKVRVTLPAARRRRRRPLLFRHGGRACTAAAVALAAAAAAAASSAALA